MLKDAQTRRDAAIAEAKQLLAGAAAEATRLAQAAAAEAEAAARRREQMAMDRIAAAEKAAVDEVRTTAVEVAEHRGASGDFRWAVGRGGWTADRSCDHAASGGAGAAAGGVGGAFYLSRCSRERSRSACDAGEGGARGNTHPSRSGSRPFRKRGRRLDAIISRQPGGMNHAARRHHRGRTAPLHRR